MARAKASAAILCVHGEDLPGRVGRDAITSAIQRNGGEVAGVESYQLSQQGIFTASTPDRVQYPQLWRAGRVHDRKRECRLAHPCQRPCPMRAWTQTSSRFIGLTRWDTLPQMAALPGLQGGLFALPDPGPSATLCKPLRRDLWRTPHPLAGLAYDGIAAIGALAAAGNTEALTKAALTQPQGFRGTSGVFRLLPNGINERGLAVATFQNNQVVILDQAPRSFGSAGL